MVYDELVSVIVPAYNAADTIRRCVLSIEEQTYKNIEIIVVDDGSTDNTLELLEELCEEYSNIEVYHHEKNMGLFAARLTGVKYAKGTYLGFVDSDDYVSIDYFRILAKAMTDECADIVVGDFYLQYSDGRKEYFNLDPFKNEELDLSGEQVLDRFMRQQGLFYGWQLVWNKLYRTQLWKKRYDVLSSFSRNHMGLTMTEDIAFSAAIWTIARKVINVRNANYLYCQSEKQSTNQNQTDEKYLENLKQIKVVFDFFKTMLKETGRYDYYEKDFNAWQILMGKIYVTNFREKNVGEKPWKYLKKEFFQNEPISPQNSHDMYFYSLRTTVDEAYNWFENIKRDIACDNTKVVSFDVFDTVIYRPLWFPTDLFYLMNNYFMDMVDAKDNIDYAQIRIESEKSCRERMKWKKPGQEDITLDDIFEEMEDRYVIQHEVCEKLKEKEMELEVKYCLVRRSGKELYDLATQLGKEVMFVSDMYLSREIIKIILENNGYLPNKIYVSSEIGVGKYTGNLYKHILKKNRIKPEQWLHIGDNWDSDVEMAMKCGLKAGHLCKATEIFRGVHGEIFSGQFFKNAILTNPANHDLNYSINGYIGFRTMFAVVANKLFDNPYVSYNKDSDFNGNIKNIGYFLVGMYAFSVTQWLIEEMAEKKIEYVHFVARDGWLLKCVYDQLDSVYRGLPKSNYLYVSRKSMLLANIIKKEDLYSLINNINIFALSPDKFLEYFDGILGENEAKEFLEKIKKKGFKDNLKQFESRYEYEKFLKLFIELCFDHLSWENYRENTKEYLDSNIHNGDVMVDIGYSGRVENCIHTITGRKIDSYYIHNNSEIIKRRQYIGHFKNKVLYDYKPDITGVVREHVFMKCAPSTIGYKRTEDGVAPNFEEDKLSLDVKLATEQLQSWALQFTRDMVDIFGEDIKQLYYRYEDGTYPFEWWLQKGKLYDRSIFKNLEFEDDLGIGKTMNALDFWNSEIDRTTIKAEQNIVERIIREEIPVTVHDTIDSFSPEYLAWRVYNDNGIVRKNRIRKMLYWMVVNPKFMKQRLKDYMKGRL